MSKKELEKKLNKVYNAVFWTSRLSFFGDCGEEDRIGRTKKDVAEIKQQIKTILDHFKLEYVEITEKNGGIKEYSKLRKVAKKSKVK